GLSDNSTASGDGNWFTRLGGIASRNLPQPPLQTGRTPASISDTGAPAAQFVPSGNPNSVGGLAGRIAALAGIDPQNPARSPQDDELRSNFYRDDPAWFLQVRR